MVVWMDTCTEPGNVISALFLKVYIGTGRVIEFHVVGMPTGPFSQIHQVPDTYTCEAIHFSRHTVLGQSLSASSITMDKTLEFAYFYMVGNTTKHSCHRGKSCPPGYHDDAHATFALTDHLKSFTVDLMAAS